MINPFFSTQFFARGDDNGFYYLKQVDGTSTLWWFAEHSSHNWANVFRGRLVRGDRADDRWQGNFIDVPKGLACAHGPLDMQMQLILPGLSLINKISEGPYGLRTMVPGFTEEFVGRPVTRLTPGFSGEGLNNLTGVWLGDDGGTYYIREVSSTGEIAWVGEHPEAVPTAPAVPVGRRWVNVFMGQREGERITGEWTDVPKGEVNQDGEIDLQIMDENLLRIIRKTGGFGGNDFHRQGSMQLSLQWISLEVLDQQEWFFEGDEPYFMALIVKMDGRTVDFGNLAAASADLGGSFFTPMLGDNVGAGFVADLRARPAFTTDIVPIPGASVEQMQTVFGIALRGWEKDFSSDAWRNDRLANWRSVALGRLNRSLRSDGSAQFGADTGAWHESFSWHNEDDNFGLASVVFSMSDLLALVGRAPRELVFDLRGGDVHYRVRANLTVSGSRGSCEP